VRKPRRKCSSCDDTCDWSLLSLRRAWGMQLVLLARTPDPRWPFRCGPRGWIMAGLSEDGRATVGGR